MNEAALTISADGTILFCNKRFSDLLKMPLDNVIGRKLIDFVQHSLQASLLELIAQTQKEPSRKKLLLRSLDGYDTPTQFSGTHLETEAGPCTCLVVTDLTEVEARTDHIRFLEEHQEALKASQKETQESERKFRGLFENSTNAVLFTIPEGPIIAANPAACALLGWTEEELCGMGSSAIMDTSDPRVSEAVEERRRTGFIQGWEFTAIHRDGKRIPIEVDSAIIPGEPVRSFSFLRDITARKQNEERLRESEQRFRLALNNSPVLVAMQDSHLVYQWAYNTRTRRPEDVVGKTDADLFAPEDMASILEAKSKVLETGEVVRHALWLTSNGQRVFLDCYYEPVQDSAGKIIGIGIAAVNLTEQKRAEEALRQSEERYRTLFENMSEGFALHEIVTDEQGRPMDYRLIEVNPAFERMTGLKRADVLGKRVLEILPDTEAHWIDSYGRVAITGEPVHFENYSAALGRWFAVYAYQPAPRQFAVVFTDITSRKRTEQALATAHSQMQDIIDHTPDIVYAFDLQERFIMANASLAALFNTTKEQVIGKRRHELMPHEDAEWHESHDRKVIDSGTILEFEEYSNLADRPITWLTKKFPLRDVHGTVYGVAGISADISDRKQNEEALRAAKDQLEIQVSQRTANLIAANRELEARAHQLRMLAGELTMAEERERKRLAEILHDGLQQNLAAAKLQVGGLAGNYGNDGANAAAQIEQLLSDAIKMSRSLSAELSPPVLYDRGLSPAIDWLARMMKDRHGFSVVCRVLDEIELPEDVKVMLFQSIKELLFNSVKHSGVSSAEVKMQADSGNLRITVSDSGRGFDPESIGTGVDGGGFGLFSIRERLALLGGGLEIDSAPGRGTRFTLVTPFSCEAIGKKRPQPPPAQAIRVLLVGDHPLFRDGLARLCKREPDLHVVGHAGSGGEAVALAGELKPDVILMDVNMPEMNGIEATAIIHQRQPEIQIIGLSMYEDASTIQSMRQAGAIDYITKGCSATELISSIRACEPRREMQKRPPAKSFGSLTDAGGGKRHKAL